MISRGIILLIILGILPFAFACDKKAEDTFNPKVPLIESIVLTRYGEAVEDAMVYSGELITITVTASAQSVIGDCYTPPETEEEPENGNGNGDTIDLTAPTPLEHAFQVLPPPESNRSGELTKDDPPGNIAQWRVPKADDILGHESGLNYTIRVTCFDDCLDLTTVGEIYVNVFADKGPPVITLLDVASRANGEGTWVTEEKDSNDFHQMEPADEVRMRVEASSRSDASLCLGLGITPARSLYYSWEANSTDINLIVDPDPVENKTVYFDVPEALTAGDSFTVTMTVLDTCSGASTLRSLHFIVVEPPIIVSATVVAGGYELEFNLYSGYYEVIPSSLTEIVAHVENADPLLCSWMGYILTREYSWIETLDTTPALNLVYENIPDVDNNRSRLTFITPKVYNGTKYNFRLTATDRCNGLSVSKDYPFMIIVPPVLGTMTVQEDSYSAYFNEVTGRYEIEEGATISVFQAATCSSDTTFCTGRGIGQDESLEYKWEDGLGAFDFAYDPIPYPNTQSALYFIVPNGAAGYIDTLTVTVTDRCNGLSTSRDIEFEVVNP